MIRQATSDLASRIERGRRVYEKMPDYQGPADALSHPQHDWLVKPVNLALADFFYRSEISGKENIPSQGKVIFCPTHPTTADPAFIPLLTSKPLRYMCAHDQFGGVRGKMLGWAGAYPVNRHQPDIVTLEHTLDIANKGLGLCIFPEGRCSDDHHSDKPQVGALRTGAAHIALSSHSDAIVPISIVYREDDKPRIGERLASLAGGAGIACLGIATAMAGGPFLAAGAALSSGLAGSYLAGKAAWERTQNPSPQHPLPQYLACLTGNLQGMAGGLAAGIVAGLGMAALAPGAAIPLALVGAMGFLGLAESHVNRKVADIKIGKPIEVAPYQEYSRREGKRLLTEKLHSTLGHLKEEQLGVPYDDAAPKILDKLLPHM